MNLEADQLKIFPSFPLERLLLFLLFFQFFYPVFSQEKISFHDTSKGLSQGTVTSIVQDKYGFLWVGTQYGLNKFDGQDYVQYHHIEQEANSLIQNNITSLATDDKNNLWIGTYGGGLDKLDLITGDFSHYNVGNNKLSNDYVTDLYIDQRQLLWVGTEKGGINVIDTETGLKKSKVDQLNLEQIREGTITALSGNDEFVLAGTWGAGLLIINPGQGTVSKEMIIEEPIRAIDRSSLEEFVIATNQGIYTIVPGISPAKKEKFSNPILEKSVILSVHIDKAGNQYFGTENNGLFHKSTNGKLIQYSSKNNNRSNPIAGNSIWAIFEDDHGIIWIGLYLKGLNKIDELEEMFKKIQYGKFSSQLDLVSAIEESKEGKLWLGTDGMGLFSYNLSTGIFEEYEDLWGASSEKVVTALLFDSNENLWIGTWQDGVKIFYPETQQARSLYFDDNRPQDCISGDYIHSIFEDNYQNIWITSFRDGLDILDRNGQKIKTIPEEKIISLKIRALIQDCDQNIILGTEVSGVQVLEIDEEYNILSTHSFLDKESNQDFGHSINDLFIDKECNLWIGSNGGLIYKKYQEESFQVYTTKDGLPSNMISSIEEDKSGLIWVSTNQGIFSFDKTTKVVKHFNSHDGLLSNEFLHGASLHSQSGKMFFGNTAGVNYFTPDSIKSNAIISPVYITNILVSGNKIELLDSTQKSTVYNGQEVVLKHDQNDITFEFTSLNATQAEQNQFRFRLEGTDDLWQNVRNKKSVSYRDLKPGIYRFEVMGSNNDEVWNPTPATFSFRIKKPFYNTYLAWFFYLLAVSAILYFFIKNLLLRERLQADLELEHLQLEQFKKIDQLKSQFFANISHEFMTPLTMIISPLKGIRKKSSMKAEWNTIDIMIKHAERLEKYIRQILDLSKLDSGTIKLKIDRYEFNSFLNSLIDSFQSIVVKKGIPLSRNIPKEPLYLYFDLGKLERVFLNLLSNAFKYTEKGGKVNVEVESFEDFIKVHIRDTGIGIATDHIPFIFDRFYREKDETKISGTGLGLSISKQLVELQKGKIEVESEEHVGTCFTITLYKGKSHFDPMELKNLTAKEDDLLNTEEIIKDAPVLVKKPNHKMVEDEKQPVVLVVEDNPDIQNFIKTTLIDDYNVILADDGAIGYELAQQTIPDVIVTDVMMPNLDGYGMCKKLKKNELTSHIAIIMLTVKSSEENQKEGLEIGVDHYLTKPFNPELLKFRIKNILAYRKKTISSRLETKSLEPQMGLQKIGLSTIDEKFLEKLNLIVLDNLSDSNFSNSNLEVAMGVSKSQLYRKLKALIGESANVYIRRIRLEEAAKLIQKGELNISEVTYKVGFNDLQYFRTCFKKQFGINPSDFLKKSEKMKGEV